MYFKNLEWLKKFAIALKCFIVQLSDTKVVKDFSVKLLIPKSELCFLLILKWIDPKIISRHFAIIISVKMKMKIIKMGKTF